VNRDLATLRTIRRTYDRRAGWFDAFVRWASLGRDARYRAAACDALRLDPGDRVLDLGGGTGLNLPWLAPATGPAGRVILADLSRPMLAEARARARSAGWDHVTFLQAEGGRLRLAPASLDAAISTYALTTIPDWPAALDAMVVALKPGGRIALLDDRLPPGWFVGPGFMMDALRRDGWRDRAGSIARRLGRGCADVVVRNLHGGLIYLVAAARRA
jgi:demethylmenaquinone methyltransferase/2-methoxy-6-polyprenyl-1,4-benzoquinol methylase